MQTANKNKKHTSTILVFLGAFLYLNFIINASFSIAMIWTFCFLYLWVLITTHLNIFSYLKLINVLCGTGVVISITIFFMYGVEELAYPEGAIIFKQEEIAKSLLLFFISTLPLYLKKQTKNKEKKERTSKKEKRTTKGKWEEATLEDVESGNFEPI